MGKGKKIIVSFMLGSLLLGNVAHGMATHAAISIVPSQHTVKSDSVGVGKEAKYWAYNTPSSSRNMTMHAYACWIGWPYSREKSIDIVPTGVFEYREPQSKDSAFYIALTGYNKCYGSGNVTVQ